MPLNLSQQDYTALCQKDERGERSPEEMEAFRSALASMQIWYAHTLLTTFLTRQLPPGYESLPGYNDRGWPTCESSWAALAKESRNMCWRPIFDVMGSSAYHRPPPQTPSVRTCNVEMGWVRLI